MVRHPQPLPSIPKRNRITFKSRLKVIFGDHNSESNFIDEDEEKNRFLQRVAGVDQEDANEHHLQQVLLAAEKAHASAAISNKAAPAAYIPTPDSTGIADNFERLYPPDRYKDTFTRVCSSRTVEESITGGLAHGIAYYMDERDKDWLDRNNEEARGEGTSAQAAAVCSARGGARSMKAKGKEAESCTRVKLSEDEFELVMGLFELVTHEETEYLHHSLQSGMAFPEFSNYQEVFSNHLSPTLFALLEVPRWVPQPSQLLDMAQTVYPHWRERRSERGGHRIIPSLNADEADTLNESYVCFRQREVKAMRKTRASQANPTEKLTLLQKQLEHPLELASKLLQREAMKKDSVDATFCMWKSRVEMVDVKRKNTSLGSKGDEELLLDREKPPAKKHDTRSRSHHHKGDSSSMASSARLESQMRPSHRASIFASEVETALFKRKELDQEWESVVDNPYTAPLVPHASRMFRFMPPSGSPKATSPSGDSTPALQQRKGQYVRLRSGRGGRTILDRRHAHSSTTLNLRARIPPDMQDDDEGTQRLAERWRFDADDVPVVPPEGSEEQDRMLVDEYDIAYLRHTIRIAAEVDPAMITDNTLIKQTADGKRETVVPYRIGGHPHSSNIVHAARIQQQPSSSSAPVPSLTAATLNSIRKATGFRTPPTAVATTNNGSGRPAINLPYVEPPPKTEEVPHAPLLAAMATSDVAQIAQMAKYIPPNLRSQWATVFSQQQQAASTNRKPPTPNVAPSVPSSNQNY